MLKGSALGPGGNLARKSLVVLQFAVLIGLLVAAIVIYRQHIYATRDALRVDADQMLILRSPCRPSVVEMSYEHCRACGVPRFAPAKPCSTERLSGIPGCGTALRLPIDSTSLDFGVFGLCGIKPLAGSLPTDDQRNPSPMPNASQVVINETAARRFGFKTPAAAIGQPLPLADEEVPAGLAEMTTR